MQAETRTIVTFKSTSFNMTEPKSYFINPCCFGDDVAKWLLRELRSRGLKADTEPGQEDFGWYFNLEVAGTPHTFVVGHQAGDQTEEGPWVIWIERRRGLIGSLLGGRNRGIDPTAARTLHSILIASPQVQDVRWYSPQDFDKSHEDLGAPEP